MLGRLTVTIQNPKVGGDSGSEGVSSREEALGAESGERTSDGGAAMKRPFAGFRFQRHISAIVGIVALAIGYLAAVKFAIALF